VGIRIRVIFYLSQSRKVRKVFFIGTSTCGPFCMAHEVRLA